MTEYERTNGYCDYCDYNHSGDYLRIVDNMNMCPYHFQEWQRDQNSFCVSEHKCEDCWIKIFGHYVWRQMELAELSQHFLESKEHCQCKKVKE